MITIRPETIRDIVAREALLDEALGAARFTKAAERLREDRLPAEWLSFVACREGKLVGTVRLWNVSAGPGRPALLLGPLAVARHCRSAGIGTALMRRAMAAASSEGYAAVLLVGDAPYYARFGFSAEKTGDLWLPGPYERDRLLACELRAGALDGARGLISATGRHAPKPDLAALVTNFTRNDITAPPRRARAG
ncbi:MAG: N-acetyltransferase [Bradyrhizobiaceae bacterium]|nr:N-acetyltransferase [Hyphomicrobiales bacterium]MBV9426755.1 N-acetyltransferase [Bradyrhizobiaceae bacterium]